MDCSLPGSSIHRILQWILEWIAISFSRDLPNPAIKPGSPALQADFFPRLSHALISLMPDVDTTGVIAGFNSLYHLASGYSGLVIKILHCHILCITVLYKGTKANQL